ncbi:MAG: glycosyltransferase family 2 protein [Thermodesulfobacteriota bacterium]
MIIPAFNEEETLRGVILGIRSFLSQANILVVNDGSTDSTGDIAREEGVLVLEHPYNMGIGATMQTGFLYALNNGYNIAVQIDGDGQHDARFITSLIKPILDGQANLVIGTRYLSDGGFKSTFLRKLGIRFFTTIIWIFTGKKITDPTSGFRAMDRKGIELFSKEYPSDYPEVEALISAYKKGLHFQEIPVTMRNRQGGASSIGILSALYYMVKVTLSISIGSFRRVK